MSGDIFARNKDLNKKIARSDVGTRLTRMDRMVKWLAFSVALDIVLSIGLAVLAKVAYDVSKTAEQASSQARVNCLAANQSRAQSQQLWNFVLSLPPPSNESSSQRQHRLASTNKFKAYIKKIFRPRNCTATALVQPSSPQPLPSATSRVGTSNSQSQRGAQHSSHVTVTVVVTSRPSPAASPSSHSPPPSSSPSNSPTPQPSPTKTCIIGPLCLPPIGARSSWLNAPRPGRVLAPGGIITTTQIEALVTALQPSAEVHWDTQVLPSRTPLSLVRLLAPWMFPTRAVISIQSSSWGIQVVIPLTSGT